MQLKKKSALSRYVSFQLLCLWLGPDHLFFFVQYKDVIKFVTYDIFVWKEIPDFTSLHLLLWILCVALNSNMYLKETSRYSLRSFQCLDVISNSCSQNSSAPFCKLSFAVSSHCNAKMSNVMRLTWVCQRASIFCQKVFISVANMYTFHSVISKCATEWCLSLPLC